MRFFYNVGIILYGFGIRVASLFNPKAKKWIKGRKNYFTNLPVINPNSKVIWFHCASLGEFDQGLPLMNKFKKEDPSTTLLVTFFSPSGIEFYQKRQHKVDIALYLPLDTPGNAKRFIKHFNPTVTVFVKYEFWINHLLAAQKMGSKLYCISGLFRPDQPFFKWYGGYFRKGLEAFNTIFVQNQVSADLLHTIELKNILVSGDTRIDRVIENKKNIHEDDILEHFKDGKKLVVLGSSWPEGERLILPWVNESKLKVIIAPHDISETHISQIGELLEEPYQRYTSYDRSVKCDVLILDTIGHLSNAYSYADVAYIGGGFKGSLHNILEPAVFGVPVLFGPRHDKYPEATSFLNEGIGFEFTTTKEFRNSIGYIISDLNYFKKKTEAYIESQSGAVDRIYNKITSN